MTARVVMLTTSLARGGAETQAVQLAMTLRRRGGDVSVVSLLQPNAFREELAASGVAAVSLGFEPGVASPLGFRRLASVLRKLRPQVLHAHMFHANLMARSIRLISPVPVVISTIHSVAESARDSGAVRRRDWLYRVTDRLSDVTVCVSRAVAGRHTAIHAVSGKRLRVIPNGVDVERFRAHPERRAGMRRTLDIGGEFAWLAVGRLMWKKDYPTMLRAMARQKEGVLLIAGAGPLEAELQALAAGLGAKVRFLGARDDVPELMNACDGLLLSSLVEGLPMVLLEAAASGLPAVASDAGGVREAVLDGHTGFVAPRGDPVAFGLAMSRLANLSVDERSRMGAAAREHAVARFELGGIAGEWERLYGELLHSARCGMPGAGPRPSGSGWTPRRDR